jgi:moderate conductance mechanosensitive channel
MRLGTFMHLLISSPGWPPEGNWDTALRVGVTLLLVAVVFRGSGPIVRWLLRRYEKRYSAQAGDTAALISLKRRETAVSVLRTTLRYFVILLAALVLFQSLTGSGTITAVAGASLIVVLVGFAGQRFLTDILTGMFMLFEGWYAVGDTVVLEPWKLEGVVEEVGLRATTLRAVNGERIRIHNSQILAVRQLPRGLRELELELFVSDEEEARALIEQVAAFMPVGPMQFVRRPTIVEVQRLDDELYRMRVRTATAAGREWLAENFLPDVIKERAREGLILHGPVVTEVDSSASFGRYARYYENRTPAKM